MPIEAAPTAPAAPSLRDSLVSAIETVESAPVDTAPPADTPPADAPKAEAAAPVETEAQKAERLRDEKGRFVEGKPEPKKEAPKAEAAPVAPPKPKVPRPSSWKKELEPHWESLAPEVQAYVGQREREFATGVSTYKGEADRAREVMQAIDRFTPELQKHNIPVTKWITDLGTAHHTLALGSPQDKVQQVVRIIQGYGVDAQALFDLMSGKQPQYQGAAPQPSLTPQDIERVVEQRLQKEKNEAMTKDAEAQLKAFTDAKDEKGQAKYPYFDDVKGTMAGILQAGLAQDYPSAYDAALRMPQHSNIWDAMQKQQTQQTTGQEVEAKKQAAAKARSQAVSVKSSTPTVAPPADGKKGLRATISEQFDKVGASRV